MKPIHTEIYKGVQINIYQDDNPVSPRTWDNFGLCVFSGKHAGYGDDNNYTHDGCNSWDDFALKNFKKGDIFLPVYMYSHSGETISTKHVYPYNDRWDSGQLGYIVAPVDKIKTEYTVKRISPATKKKVIKILENEIETLDNYIRGNVYGYEIVWADQDPDSCLGYYGDYDSEYGALAEAKSIIDHSETKLKSTNPKWFVSVNNNIRNALRDLNEIEEGVLLIDYEAVLTEVKEKLDGLKDKMDSLENKMGVYTHSDKN